MSGSLDDRGISSGACHGTDRYRCRAARIIAVADVAEAMGRVRPYKAAAGREATLAFLVANRGTLFDSEVVCACEAVLEDGSFVL